MKKLLLILALLALPVFFVGCGDGGGGDPVTGGEFVPDDGGTTGGTTDFDPTTSTIQDVTLAFGDGSTSTTLYADGTSSGALVRVTVKDQNGNAAPDQTVTFESFQGGTFSSTSVITDVDGKAGVSYLPPTTLGQDLITARCGGVQSDPLTVNLIAGKPASAQFSIAPTAINPGGKTTLTVTNVKDAADHLLSGVQVSFFIGTNVSGGSLASSTASTSSNGSASTTYTAGLTSGTDTFYIQAGTYTTELLPLSLTVSPTAIVVGGLTLTAQYSTITANGATATLITAKVVDINGTGASGIPVTFTLDAASTSLGTLTTTVGTTQSNGEAYAQLTAGTTVGTATITATAAGFPASTTVTLAPGAPANMTVNAAPNPIFATASTDIYAAVTDASGNAITNQSITFELPIASNNSNSAFTSQTTSTDTRGIAHIVYTAGSSLGTDTINVFTGNVTTSVSIPVQANPNSITKLAISNDPSTVVPSGGSTTITIKATDQSGQPVEGVTLTAAATGSATVVVSGSTTTDVFGEMSFTVSDVVDENINFSVVGGTVRTETPVIFGPTLSLIPTAVNAIGSADLTALMTDPNGIPLANQDVAILITSNTDEDNVFATSNVGTTDATGSFDVTLEDTGGNAGTTQLVATAGDNLIQSATSTVTFSLEAASFILEASTSAAALTTAESATITAKVTNAADGLPAGGQQVTITVDGSATAPPAPLPLTDANGLVTADISDAVAENVTVTVSFSGAGSITIPLYFGATIQLFPPTAEGVGDGTTTTELQAIVQSATGAPIVAVPVDYSATGSAFLTAARTYTDAEGIAVIGVKDSTIEVATITASVGSLSDSSDINFTAGAPANMTVDSYESAGFDPADSATWTALSPLTLALFNTAKIVATVTDELGNSVPDGTQVLFETTGGSITATASTSNGIAIATLDGSSISGNYTITVTAGAIVKTLNFEVTPSSSGTIEVLDVTPGTIHVAGTSGVQSSTIQFIVKDIAGNPVADGTEVTVELDALQLGGGEAISAGGAYSTTNVTAATNNGIAQVVLRSGSIAGTVDITATEPIAGISTVAQVVIVGSLPDGEHLTISAETLNLAGGLYTDLPSTITAIAADRFGNVVADGTTISFESECGRIGESAGFTASTQQGVATAVFRTSNPMIPTDNLQGPAPAGDYGRCRILAYTTGNESYIDANGDGVFNAGDTCSGNLGEPYFDENDNGSWEAGEFYVDIDGSNNYTTANATCDTGTIIWTSMNLLMTSSASLDVDEVPSVAPAIPTYSLPVGGSKQFEVTYGDIFGNMVTAGTSLDVAITTGPGYLTGTTGFTVGDSTAFEDSFFFTVHSDDTVNNEEDYNATSEITVTLDTSTAISLTDDVTNVSRSNDNGVSVFYLLSGTLNTPPPATAPTVLWTVPADNAINVVDNAEMTIAFSEAMEPLTVTTSTITTFCGGVPYNWGSITSNDDTSFTFKHAAASTFPAASTCDVTVTTSVRDAQGTAMAADYTFSFDVF